MVFMKKFMKRCAITASVLFLAGLLLAVAGGSARGSDGINEAVRRVLPEGPVRVELGDITDAFRSPMFSGTYTIFSDNVPKYCPGEGIEDLDIQVGGCNFETRVSEDDKFYIEAKKVHKLQGYVENGTLCIRVFDGEKTWNKPESCSITLYVPEGFSFGAVDVEIGAGNLSFTNLCAGDYISMEVGAGKISADGIRSNELELEVGAGKIELRDMEVWGKCSAEIGMGSFEGRGTLMGDVDIECAMGSVELELSDSEKSFDYTLECAMGNIALGNKRYSGIAEEKDILNGAHRTMSVECAMGSVRVSFDSGHREECH